MKQEFEMKQSEMDEILRINKEVKDMPVMMVGTCTFGGEKREAINAYWKTLGEKYGFDDETVEGSSKGKLFFLATSKPKVIPKTREEIEMDKYLEGVDWNYLSYGNTRIAITKIVNQLESCNYESVGGYLKTNVAFLALKRMTNN